MRKNTLQSNSKPSAATEIILALNALGYGAKNQEGGGNGKTNGKGVGQRRGQEMGQEMGKEPNKIDGVNGHKYFISFTFRIIFCPCNQSLSIKLCSIMYYYIISLAIIPYNTTSC